jgi:hypothetical protein
VLKVAQRQPGLVRQPLHGVQSHLHLTGHQYRVRHVGHQIEQHPVHRQRDGLRTHVLVAAPVRERHRSPAEVHGAGLGAATAKDVHHGLMLSGLRPEHQGSREPAFAPLPVDPDQREGERTTALRHPEGLRRGVVDVDGARPGVLHGPEWAVDAHGDGVVQHSEGGSLDQVRRGVGLSVEVGVGGGGAGDPCPVKVPWVIIRTRSMSS